MLPSTDGRSFAVSESVTRLERGVGVRPGTRSDRSHRPNRRQAMVILGTGSASLCFAGIMIWIGQRGTAHPLAVLVVADTIGLSFLGAGVAAWWNSPSGRLGVLMVATGGLWFVSNLQGSDIPALVAVGYWLTYLPVVVAAHLMLAYPDGRLHNRSERVVVALSYLFYLTLQGVRGLVEEPWQRIGLPTGTETSVWGNMVSANGLLFNTLMYALLVARWRRASGPARRAHAPVWFGCGILTALLSANTLASYLQAPPEAQVVLVLGYGLGLVGLPIAFLTGLLRLRLDRRRVADLVVELAGASDPHRFRALIARTLGDPSLRVGYWSVGSGSYLDADARPIDIVVAGAQPGRIVRYLPGPGDTPARPLAVLIHDAMLDRQRPLVDAVIAAACLALTNARLESLLRERPGGVDGVGARIAEASLAERRRIERDLHDGVQQRLLRLSWLAERLGSAVTAGPDDDVLRPMVDALTCEARDAYRTLRELARGIHPAVLTECGLAAAVMEQALRCPVPVVVDLPAERWSPAIEATAFFAILEALTNATKHAAASQVTISGRKLPNRVRIDVVDDGRGGADPDGSGLRGLRDRAVALGGEITVHSSPDRGTRIILELPCA